MLVNDFQNCTIEICPRCGSENSYRLGGRFEHGFSCKTCNIWYTGDRQNIFQLNIEFNSKNEPKWSFVWYTKENRCRSYHIGPKFEYIALPFVPLDASIERLKKLLLLV